MDEMGVTEEYYTWWFRYVHSEEEKGERDGREC
ncbi:hypothetical protein SAMN05216170_2327 [Thermococcus thioreducens]|uniref:Uncharacterized protein n=1 Tax=Thermococcus thioreducens TaxID=277988 RepID=A0A1I0QA87_9EURY|nr:hypothetical protein SAMN05216170_2327 [Thermococcus thioreducens]